MEKVLLPEWNQFALLCAVVNPLWSYDVEPSLLDDSFDVERCSCPLRENFRLIKGGPTGSSAAINHKQGFLVSR
jgi:hypothetical protein